MKSQLRFRSTLALVVCILWQAAGSFSIAQETIRPQFMFGGNLGNLSPQDKVIEGDVFPFREAVPIEAPQIRPLPPAPPTMTAPSSFGFPVDPMTGQTANPLFGAPQAPELGYPGETTIMPVQAMPEMQSYQSGGYVPGPGEFIPEQQPNNSAPVYNSLPTISPQAFTRRPVVIPNEPSLVGPQVTDQQMSLGQQGAYDFERTFPQTNFDSPVINEGFRRGRPTVRGGELDDYGQEFDFENKKREYPPFSEIMKTGRYFGNAELLYLKPYFQNNTAITVEGLNTGFSETFDFGYDTGNRFLLGFESKYGPGAEINYFQYDHQSRESDFTSSGGFQGESATWMAGPGQWSRLTTVNDGDRLTAVHSLEVQNLGVSFFKDWKLPIAKLGGGFGIQYVSIEQDLQSRLFDVGGVEIGSLSARHELRAFGPKFEFKYFRPVGHTKLDIIGGFSGAVLFGNRDQDVFNSVTLDTSRVGADEFLMIFDVIAGLQYSYQYADNRNFYARISLMSQAWLGGGTAMNPVDNFGFRGVGFAVGFNR
jgi:hypothetical protein